MKRGDIYFKNAPNVGNLYLEEILFEYECPMLVVLHDESKEHRFVCVCCDYRKEQRWIITKVDVSSIIDLLKDKITMREIFTRCGVQHIVGRWKHDFVDVQFTSCKLEDIPECDLPTKGMYFEDDGEFNDYITELEEVIMDKVIGYGVIDDDYYPINSYAETCVEWESCKFGKITPAQICEDLLESSYLASYETFFIYNPALAY